jgi:hypothetical protein
MIIKEKSFQSRSDLNSFIDLKKLQNARAYEDIDAKALDEILKASKGPSRITIIIFKDL